MLNKNANCYNIEKNLKYSAVISEYIQWAYYNFPKTQLKCQQWNYNLLFFIILLRETTLESKVAPTNRNSSASLFTLVRPFPKLSFFNSFTNFFWTNFCHQNKNNVVETITCFVYQLPRKKCVYYVSEHLKYCTQINEYWLNNKCLSKHSIS